MTLGNAIAALALVAAAIVLVAWGWRRGGRRARVALTALAVVAVVAGAWVGVRGTYAGVWVDSLGAVDGKVEFWAPRAHGGAGGNLYRFVSSATPDAVFGAFADAYPDAVRAGDVTAVVIGDHTFTLTYHPEGSEPYWILANDRG
ncbi:hypothetical protein [Demequina soli]|uniref:hypothetical protein n=1 Tax=Demequina soli TaxID=1638987 RepID=UPI000785B958|nr:hypothetical protein [Demequina soli]